VCGASCHASLFFQQATRPLQLFFFFFFRLPGVDNLFCCFSVCVPLHPVLMALGAISISGPFLQRLDPPKRWSAPSNARRLGGYVWLFFEGFVIGGRGLRGFMAGLFYDFLFVAFIPRWPRGILVKRQLIFFGWKSREVATPCPPLSAFEGFSPPSFILGSVVSLTPAFVGVFGVGLDKAMSPVFVWASTFSFPIFFFLFFFPCVPFVSIPTPPPF